MAPWFWSLLLLNIYDVHNERSIFNFFLEKGSRTMFISVHLCYTYTLALFCACSISRHIVFSGPFFFFLVSKAGPSFLYTYTIVCRFQKNDVRKVSELCYCGSIGYTRAAFARSALYGIRRKTMSGAACFVRSARGKKLVSRRFNTLPVHKWINLADAATVINGLGANRRRGPDVVPSNIEEWRARDVPTETRPRERGEVLIRFPRRFPRD